MRIKVISDTHGKHGFVEMDEVDILIHAGDMGTVREPIENTKVILDCLEWLSIYPAKYKVVVPGNHDTSIERNFVTKEQFKEKGVDLLIHETIQIENLKIFGSPYTPTFGIGWAYNVGRHKLDDYWRNIEENTNIVITHGPPRGILDYTEEDHSLFSQCGDKTLLNRIKEIQPDYHIFGHIHPEKRALNGATVKLHDCKTQFINAAVCNLDYNVANNGVIFNI